MYPGEPGFLSHQGWWLIFRVESVSDLNDRGSGQNKKRRRRVDEGEGYIGRRRRRRSEEQ